MTCSRKDAIETALHDLDCGARTVDILAVRTIDPKTGVDLSASLNFVANSLKERVGHLRTLLATHEEAAE